jgi:hypothetical protein
MNIRRAALLAGVLGVLACGRSTPSALAPQTRYTPQQAKALALANCRGCPKVVLPCYMRYFNEPAK